LKNQFEEFLIAQEIAQAKPASYITQDVFIAFSDWIKGFRNQKKPFAKSTIQVYLSAIFSFCRYLMGKQLVDFSAGDLERIRKAFHDSRRGYERPLPKLPPEEAVRDLLSAVKNVKSMPKKPRLDLARLRNIAMLEALRSAGMRVGELVGLKRDDLDYRQHSARVTGKGSKQRIVYFDDTAWDSIQTYLRARGGGAKGRALYSLPLFARHDRRVGTKVLPLTTDSVRLVFNELAKTAEIEIAMTPHSLRHAFATRLLESSGDLALVQDMLGHSSTVTTRIYAKVSSKRMREAHHAAFDYERKANSKTDKDEDEEETK
jgi:integrase/recombinase XerC